MSENPYDILGVSTNDTFETIKCRYKFLAKEYHPDKNHGLTDEKKKQKEEYFKKVTVAYHTLWAMKERGETKEEHQWDNIWGMMSKVTNWREIFQNTLRDVANMMQRHTMKVPVSIEDVCFGRYKKVRFVLRGCDVPVYTEINCGEYPSINYITHIESSGIHHTIRIETFIDEEDRWLDDEGHLHQEITISWSEYVYGTTRELQSLCDVNVEITIPSFYEEDTMIRKGEGWNRHGEKMDWILHIYCKQPTALEWSQEKEKLIVGMNKINAHHPQS
jgi:DnaJ-class molecular chaperone